ncbi:hypothetical protein Tco_0787592 [Tanacetum coccineum]
MPKSRRDITDPKNRNILGTRSNGLRHSKTTILQTQPKYKLENSQSLVIGRLITRYEYGSSQKVAVVGANGGNQLRRNGWAECWVSKNGYNGSKNVGNQVVHEKLLEMSGNATLGKWLSDKTQLVDLPQKGEAGIPTPNAEEFNFDGDSAANLFEKIEEVNSKLHF